MPSTSRRDAFGLDHGRPLRCISARETEMPLRHYLRVAQKRSFPGRKLSHSFFSMLHRGMTFAPNHHGEIESKVLFERTGHSQAHQAMPVSHIRLSKHTKVFVCLAVLFSLFDLTYGIASIRRRGYLAERLDNMQLRLVARRSSRRHRCAVGMGLCSCHLVGQDNSTFGNSIR